ncbi:MAG: hypothetical protein H8Z69_04355 [Nanohaloarchaea archaeon]|nr:hypothetical protein [Candidatus Nanohaloarchaea archaeon]
MKLYEHEAKKVLEDYGLRTPGKKSGEFVVKAQVLAKDRKDDGGIRFADTREKAENIAEEMEGNKVNDQKVEEVLIENKLDFSKEYYVAFLYDTDTRSPVMLFSDSGGSGIEDREVEKLVIEEGMPHEFRQFIGENTALEDIVELGSTLSKIYKAFLEQDARMIEINPLAKTGEGLVVLDAMIDLDDDAGYRRERSFPDRSDMGRKKTEREKKAKKIDENDHRGIAGKYTELEGNIGMLLCGGGASLTNMDALIEYGGSPANYTEYGGNPPSEKVYRLSKIVMSKDLNGLWHVGGTANNTNILRTMKGFCKAVREEKPDYPIVVRRDGPQADEAFELLRETREELGLNMKLFRNDTPMTKTAETLMEMVGE